MPCPLRMTPHVLCNTCVGGQHMAHHSDKVTAAWLRRGMLTWAETSGRGKGVGIAELALAAQNQPRLCRLVVPRDAVPGAGSGSCKGAVAVVGVNLDGVGRGRVRLSGCLPPDGEGVHTRLDDHIAWLARLACSSEASSGTGGEQGVTHGRSCPDLSMHTVAVRCCRLPRHPASHKARQACSPTPAWLEEASVSLYTAP